MKDYETFDLGDVKLLSGKNLKSAKITYKTYGTLSKNSDNVIVLPTFYTGTHKRNEGFFGQIEPLILTNILLSLLICLEMACHHHQVIAQVHRMDRVFPI